MNQSTSTSVTSVKQGKGTATGHVVAGALLGLAWGSSLRAWMALLAFQLGDPQKVTWQGTFAGVLLPAMVVRALDGGAVYAAKTSERKGCRWKAQLNEG